MDIPELSMAMSLSNAQLTASVAVAKLAMNTEEEMASQFTAIADSMNTSVNPNIGSYIDVRA